ncbi:uncharacterized protein PV07_00889 [Cladophialophora immunda]|uniref:Uncharacterized protein n=1 Tax=Cladophialophora immunda TaxID=569365 RepID=A0A0D2CW67_9EURO|nr:uncharacterized protein PV07_00889 [Cladophialophora immunda]KIW34090.1 hypothetical protein PV07_00889 [Cladophialophora immunda]
MPSYHRTKQTAPPPKTRDAEAAYANAHARYGYHDAPKYADDVNNSLALTRSLHDSGTTSFESDNSMNSHPESGVEGSVAQEEEEDMTPPDSDASNLTCAEIVLRQVKVPMVTVGASGPAINATKRGSISINGGVATVNGIVGANICGQFIVGQP